MANVAKVASRFSKYQKVSKFASTISKIRLAAGAIEISRGSLNILLKLTELRETPFGQALTEYLFYLELLSLSGELTAAIKNGLRKSAKKLVKHENEIRKQLDEVVIEDGNSTRKLTETDKTKFFEELKKVADNTINQTPEQMWKDFKYSDLMEIPPTKKPCFLAGTLVKTENGHLPIEQLKVGNKVYSYNLEKKQTEINTILRVYENVTQKYLKIKTQNSCIEATGQHRFWIPKQEKWLMANELKTGMHFLDTNKNLVEILNLEIIENIEKTYNLEIKNNHNYFVGQDEVLTHNTNKVFKFADDTLYDFGFYLLAETDAGRVKSELYVGITTQEFTKRADQHAHEGKAALPPKNQKPYNAWKANPKMGILPIEPHVKMTFYEATIWETYFINERGGGKAHKGLGKLLNRKTPISEKMFNDWKATGKFNPCKYFI